MIQYILNDFGAYPGFHQVECKSKIGLPFCPLEGVENVFLAGLDPDHFSLIEFPVTWPSQSMRPSFSLVRVYLNALCPSQV